MDELEIHADDAVALEEHVHPEPADARHAVAGVELEVVLEALPLLLGEDGVDHPADLGAVHNGNVGGYHLDTTLTNFLFGPRIPIRISNRITPYFQTLFGGVYGSTSVKVTVPPGTVVLPPVVMPANSTAATNAANAIALRAAAQQTAFAATFGGGLDIKINKVVSFRPIGLDYYLMRLQNLRSANDNNQHCIRYTTGLNFTFGAR